MLVDIKCRSIDPLFHADLTPNDPLFPSVHAQWPPFFPTFVSNFTYKLQIFTRFACILKNFNIKFANFGRKLHFCTVNDPHFRESTSKKDPIFLKPTQNDPFFQQNLTPNAPYFHSPVGTCMSLSYSSAPPPLESTHTTANSTKWGYISENIDLNTVLYFVKLLSTLLCRNVSWPEGKSLKKCVNLG